MIKVEVAYASVEDQRVLSLEVELGATIETVIDRSGIVEIYPEIDLTRQKVGIFGKVRRLTEKVGEGDRVEIYRALTIDPKELRRVREKKVAKR